MFRRFAGLLLLLVGVLSTPGLGLNLVQRSHCAGHAASSMHLVEPGGGHAGHQGSTPLWTRPAHSDCSHCPASECATVAPCSPSILSAALASSATFGTPSAHLVSLVRLTTSSHSTTQQPPTPPPQSIA